MAELPNWIKTGKIRIKDEYVTFDVGIKYIPLRFFLGFIRKSIGWRIWEYPRVIRMCLDRIGIVFQPYREFKGF